jgi:hypothetical protein
LYSLALRSEATAIAQHVLVGAEHQRHRQTLLHVLARQHLVLRLPGEQFQPVLQAIGIDQVGVLAHQVLRGGLDLG